MLPDLGINDSKWDLQGWGLVGRSLLTEAALGGDTGALALFSFCSLTAMSEAFLLLRAPAMVCSLTRDPEVTGPASQPESESCITMSQDKCILLLNGHVRYFTMRKADSLDIPVLRGYWVLHGAT